MAKPLLSHKSRRYLNLVPVPGDKCTVEDRQTLAWKALIDHAAPVPVVVAPEAPHEMVAVDGNLVTRLAMCFRFRHLDGIVRRTFAARARPI